MFTYGASLKKYFFAILSIVFIATLTFQSNLYALESLAQIKKIITQNYYFELPANFESFETIEDVFSPLDSFSVYMSADELNALRNRSMGNYSGVGVTLIVQEGKIFIVRVFDRSPAAKAGIVAGDELVSVDGDAVAGLSFTEVLNGIKGPHKSKVTLRILRDGISRSYILKRKKIHTTSVYPYLVLGEGVGYIKIDLFDKQTPDLLKKELKKIKKKNIQKLILDLRSNVGGLLLPTVNSLDFFLERGIKLIHTEKKRSEVITEYFTVTRPYISNISVCVLVNKASSSGAEIFAACLRENNIATIVGERTYGKGSVQELFVMDTGDGLKLTTHVYVTGQGLMINGFGVEPDIFVEQEYFTRHELSQYQTEEQLSTDAQVIVALHHLNTKNEDEK